MKVGEAQRQPCPGQYRRAEAEGAAGAWSRGGAGGGVKEEDRIREPQVQEKM